MSEQERRRWDIRYADAGRGGLASGPPPAFADAEDLFPTRGEALEIACGRGLGAVWLAGRGMSYHGVDVSPIAIELARDLVNASGQATRCILEVWDLDDGLPPGGPVDLLFCHLFRDTRLYGAMIERVKSRGMLAVATLSVVGGESGEHRALPGELERAFGHLDVLEQGESEGTTWILARKPD